MKDSQEHRAVIHTKCDGDEDPVGALCELATAVFYNLKVGGGDDLDGPVQPMRTKGARTNVRRQQPGPPLDESDGSISNGVRQLEDWGQ